MLLHYRYLVAMPLLLSAFVLQESKTNNVAPALQLVHTDTLFDMCTVLPGDEVAALSPFGRPIKQVTADDRMDGYCGCHYDLQSDDDYPQVQITLSDEGSPKAAKEAYSMRKQDWVDQFGRQPEYVPNLGDSACFMGNADPTKCDQCGMQVSSGRFLIIVALKGYYDKITAAAKMASAELIVRKLFYKKPYLNGGR